MYAVPRFVCLKGLIGTDKTRKKYMPNIEECNFCMYHDALPNEVNSVYCHHFKREIHCTEQLCEYYKSDYRLIEKTSELKNNPPINNEKLFHRPFSFKGRIGRREYILSFILCCALYYLSELLIPILDTLLIFTYLWFWIAQSIKRCHDIGNNGLYTLIPFYILWLLIADSNKGLNKYGSEPMKKYHQQISDEVPNITDFYTKEKSIAIEYTNIKQDKTNLKYQIEYTPSPRRINDMAYYKFIFWGISVGFHILFVDDILEPYLSSFDSPKYAQIGWITVLAIILTTFLVTYKVNTNKGFPANIISFLNKWSNKIINSSLGISGAIFYNSCVLLFFSFLSITTTLIIPYSTYLFVYGIYINILPIVLGTFLFFLCMVYFSYTTIEVLFCEEYINSKNNQILPEKQMKNVHETQDPIIEKQSKYAQITYQNINRITKNIRRKMNIANFINQNFPMHKGYRRLLLVCWILISLVVGFSQKHQSDQLLYGSLTLVGLLLAYFITLWIYRGFQEEMKNKK